MKRWILSGAILLAVVNTSEAQQTSKFSAAKHNEYGLHYTLPRTQLEVEVVAVKTTQKAGPYYKYANTYLAASMAIAQESETWELKEVNIRPIGVPNREEQYLVKFRSGSSPYMFLNEQGLLLSINCEPLASDVAAPTPAISAAASVLDGNAISATVTEEMMLSGSEARMAEMAAKQIYRIRESRLNLITGDVDKLPADGESFQIVMTQLEEQEQALTALFVGTTQTEQVVTRFTFDIVDELDNELFFRFSEHEGVVDKGNLSGQPVYLDLKVVERGKYPTNAKGEELSMPVNGLAYCIPGRAKAAINFNGSLIRESEFAVAQFGVVYGLAPSMFDNKKKPAYVIFFPETGAIRELGE